MVSYKDLAELQAFCDDVSDEKIRHILDDVIFEYCKYRKYGTPSECAQRREWMSLSPDEILETYANTMIILQKENKELKNKLAEASKKRGISKKE
nr:hypothetical protein [uncultured Mediterraneibacter sp.]